MRTQSVNLVQIFGLICIRRSSERQRVDERRRIHQSQPRHWITPYQETEGSGVSARRREQEGESEADSPPFEFANTVADCQIARMTMLRSSRRERRRRRHSLPADGAVARRRRQLRTNDLCIRFPWMRVQHEWVRGELLLLLPPPLLPPLLLLLLRVLEQLRSVCEQRQQGIFVLSSLPLSRLSSSLSHTRLSVRFRHLFACILSVNRLLLLLR